jgi:hypothetical protein
MHCEPISVPRNAGVPAYFDSVTRGFDQNEYNDMKTTSGNCYSHYYL